MLALVACALALAAPAAALEVRVKDVRAASPDVSATWRSATSSPIGFTR
jgi:hypothetical protein